MIVVRSKDGHLLAVVEPRYAGTSGEREEAMHQLRRFPAATVWRVRHLPDGFMLTPIRQRS